MIGTHYVMLLLAAMTQHHEIKFPSMPGMPGSVMCTWSFQLHHMLSMTSARCAFMSDDKPTIAYAHSPHLKEMCMLQGP